MEQIRIHGRGGQGVVTAAELIALAAFDAGKYAQAFPNFGVERTGAPIQSYARISEEPIITREQIYNPNILIIQDASLLETEDILRGTDKNTLFIINAPNNYQSPIKLPSKKVFFSPATEIALKMFGKNIVNTIILGSFAKHSGLITLESLKQAVMKKFADKGETIIKKNIQAVEIAFND
ncbi:MAG TPA: 2-oxoacid:acceptor oxidoreductase family protein [Candidatus Saccharimonadales bacterium]|nr:2-oxoacid:acceptor oxidoreductase family protein [Candidatus Saccharimonadales bacterium]